MRTCRIALAATLVATLAACKGSSSESAPPPPPPPPPPLRAPTIDRVRVPVGLFVMLGGRFLPPGSSTWIELHGDNFAFPDGSGEPPAVTFVRTRDVDGSATDGPSTSSVAHPDSLQPYFAAWAPLDASALQPGVYAVVLRNAAGYEARFEDAFVLPPPPSISGGEEWICATEAQPALDIAGRDLYQVPGFPIKAGLIASRTPSWDGGTLEYGLGIEATTGCRSVAFAVPGLELCSALVARLPAAVSGRTELLVALGQDPLGSATTPLGLGRRIWIERPSPARDLGARAAVDAPLDVDVWGAAIVGPDRSPTAGIDGAQLPVRATGCSPTGIASFESCTRVTATIPQGFAPGAHTIAVSTATGCTGTSSIFLASRPVVTAVSPTSVCEGTQRFKVSGDGFHRSWSAVADGTAFAAGAGFLPCVPDAGAPMCVELSNTALPIGTHQLGIRNDTWPPVWSNTVPFVVTPGPPHVGDFREGLVYSGATRPVLVRAWGITGEVAGAELVPYEPGSGTRAGPAVSTAARLVPGGVEVTFPALGGNLDYHVVIHDASPCASDENAYTFHATDQPVLASEDFEAGVSYEWSRSDEPGTPLAWLAGDGNPGSAAGASRAGPGTDWYLRWSSRARLYFADRADLGSLRFDLRVSGAGDASTSAPLVLWWEEPLSAGTYRLERSLPQPLPGVWTTFQVALDDPDGWTRVHADGERRAATIDDFRGELIGVHVLGTWWTGAAAAAIDNVSLELAR